MINEFELPDSAIHPFIQKEIDEMQQEAKDYGVVLTDFEQRARLGMLYARVKSKYEAMNLERKVLRGRIILDIEEQCKDTQTKIALSIKEAMAMQDPEYISFLHKFERATLCCYQLQTLIKKLDQKMDFEKTEQIAEITEKKHSQGEGRY